MSLPRTEAMPEHQSIDALSMDAAASILLNGQAAAIEAARSESLALSVGASLMAQSVRAGGRLIYGAAGSSGLMALADAGELHGTFGIPYDQISMNMAGGVPSDAIMTGETEDETEAAHAIEMHPVDVAIILSASGTTPFAVAMCKAARDGGAKIIGIANNAGTPLLRMADVPICLATPPEVIAGSTRLAAGTAQKAALNVMSSLMGVRLGHVYQGMMVNLVADNTKLKKRAITIICQITKKSEEIAVASLQATGGQVKAAVLVAMGAAPPRAFMLLDKHRGHLGPCLISLHKKRQPEMNKLGRIS